MNIKSLLLIVVLLFQLSLFGQRDTGYIPTSVDTTPGLRQIQDPINDPSVGDIKSLCEELAKAPYIKDGLTPKSDALISNYGFRKLIRKNFNNLILGNEDVSKIGRFATLDIDDNNSFSFSPFSWESNPKKSTYQNIFSLKFSGKLNSEKFFKLSDYRDLSAGISWVHILNRTNYVPISTNLDLIRAEFINCVLPVPLEELCSKYKATLNNAWCDSAKRHELYSKFVDEYTDLEAELMEPFWRSKNFWWINVDVTAFGIDKVRFVPDELIENNLYQPLTESIFTPGINIALNYFTQKKSGSSFLMSIWGELNRKHSLSEIYEPEEFQSIDRINDSLFRSISNEETFVTSFDELDKQLVPDFGARIVGMLAFNKNNRKRQLGISLSFQRKGLVPSENFSSLFISEVGLVIPFLKSDNESTFNLEIFKRWQTFSNFPADNEAAWGLRFNVPLTSR